MHGWCLFLDLTRWTFIIVAWFIQNLSACRWTFPILWLPRKRNKAGSNACIRHFRFPNRHNSFDALIFSGSLINMLFITMWVGIVGFFTLFSPSRRFLLAYPEVCSFGMFKVENCCLFISIFTFAENWPDHRADQRGFIRLFLLWNRMGEGRNSGINDTDEEGSIVF